MPSPPPTPTARPPSRSSFCDPRRPRLRLPALSTHTPAHLLGSLGGPRAAWPPWDLSHSSLPAPWTDHTVPALPHEAPGPGGLCPLPTAGPRPGLCPHLGFSGAVPETHLHGRLREGRNQSYGSKQGGPGGGPRAGTSATCCRLLSPAVDSTGVSPGPGPWRGGQSLEGAHRGKRTGKLARCPVPAPPVGSRLVSHPVPA